MTTRNKAPGLLDFDRTVLLFFKMPAAILVVGLLAVPIFGIIFLSFSDPLPGFSNYAALFASSALTRVFITSLRISLLTTLFASVIGYAIAYEMYVASRKEARFIIFCLMIPLWTSILVRAFAWVAILQSNGLVNNALISYGIISSPISMVRNEFGVIVAMVHVMIPFAALPIYSSMTGVDKRTVMAARSLGGGPWTTFWRIFFPQTLPGIGAGMILTFITSIGFYVTPVILGGGKVVMIAEYISIQVIETLRWGLGSMLATVLLAIVLTFVAFFRRLTVLRQDSK